MSKILLEHGVKRNTRGVICWELPEPVMIKIKNPLSRWVTVSERQWNVFLPYAESLWLALGRNDLEFIKYYLPKMVDFSDDGLFLRGGYGQRLRYYNGNTNDYKKTWNSSNVIFKNKEVDQFNYVIENFKRDLYTRQAIITIGDPPKDCFNVDGTIKQTKDLPCTCSLQFMQNCVTNKLDLTVYLRSNDFIWGSTAINIFNYTFMQEYMAKILNLEIGNYYHIANNLHYYEYHKGLIEKIAQVQDHKDEYYVYNKSFTNLKEFDRILIRFATWESRIRIKKLDELEDFNDDFFNDWAKVLFFKINKTQSITFNNPILNQIINLNHK
jgi:thymidylate synthase